MFSSRESGTAKPRPHRSAVSRSHARTGKVIAGTLVAGLTVAAVSVTGAQGAGATTAPLAQSVGRFLDGAVGTSPIQALANVQDARATAPGTQTAQNPLDLTVLNTLHVPLTGALQLPSLGIFQLGVANQVAVANTNGSSYGGSGAVNNSGGVSLGGNNNAFPANATIDLSAAALGSVGIPALPGIGGLTGTGSTTASALGGISASIGAVSALAETPVAGGTLASGHTPASSHVASVTLNVGSPAIGALLGQVSSLLNPTTLTGLLSGVLGSLGNLFPSTCSLTSGQLPTTISLENGAIVVDPATGNIAVNIGPLLQTLLGKDISNLTTSNFDLIRFLVQSLPTILTQGLESVVTSLVTPLQTAFQTCLTDLGPLAGTLGALLTTLTGAVTTLEGALNGLANQLGAAGGSGLTALATGLQSLVDIGLNVQSGPGIQPHDATYPFTTKLDATPDQATAVVPNQTLVRAIEINVLAVSDTRGLATLALANAAAGPSTAVVTPTTPTTPVTTPTTPNTNIPTGVPAGFAKPGGSPDLPLVLLVVGLLAASGGAVAYKFRGRHSA